MLVLRSISPQGLNTTWMDLVFMARADTAQRGCLQGWGALEDNLVSDGQDAEATLLSMDTNVLVQPPLHLKSCVFLGPV